MTNTSKFWTGALIVGAVGIGAVVTNRNRIEMQTVPIAASEAESSPVVSKAALPMPATRRADPVAPLVVTSGLASIVKPLLQPGTDMTMASDGFTTSESFVATAHAAKNLGIPFVVLKDHVVAQRLSLADAIRQIKPEANAKTEAARAIAEARASMSRPT